MRKGSKIKCISVVLVIVLMTTIFTGCQTTKEAETEEVITVYLWSNSLNEKYTQYVQSKLPDVNIQFVVGQNDLQFYEFMNENGALPDIIMSRRFSRFDALALKDSLMDLSSTEEAGAVYESYLKDFTNTDGSINWLPMCGVGDGIVANKALFEKYNIPFPTDYDSFVAACQTFEKFGIRGFSADFVYDYTCMEILQGLSIPEITSMDGSIWRSNYEDPSDAENGLDKDIWPVVFENMEQFIKDVKIGPDDLTLDYGSKMDMLKEGKLAMCRAGSGDVLELNRKGVDAIFLPYFGKNGEQWILTYPEFQVALNKDLEQNSNRKEMAMRVLGTMLSEEAQNILSNEKDVVNYNKNVELELSSYLDNLKPIIARNNLYIRIASNDFFVVSKDVVTKMIEGKYDAEEAYEAFDSQLRAQKENQSEIILSSEKGYSNIFFSNGGNESYSVMANSIRNMYDGEILIAPGFSFTGSVFATDYTEKQVASMIMPNVLFAYSAEMTGKELKECVRAYVEGIEGGFIPFNRGSLPIVSGITIKVKEQAGKYTLLNVQKSGKEIKDHDVFKVICLNAGDYMNPFLENSSPVFKKSEKMVKEDWIKYIKEGGSLAGPEKYIFLN